MHLSKMALSLGQSATLRLNELANTLKAEGKPVIHLGGGEPEEKIPDGAYSASLKKLDSRYVRYTATSGVPDLKAGIAAYTEKHYGVKPAAGNIVVSSGAKQAIYNFLLSVVDPDDEVVFPAPYWVSYPEMVRMAGGEPVILRPEAGSVVPTLEQFEAAFNQHTKAVMLNSPNNPSGAVFSPDFIKGLV
jgi:aspartate aminotransferase